MNVSEFIAKWEKSELTERSSAQQHFLDLCELLGHPKPAAVDPTGASFTFEKGATKQDGSDGFADVWKKGFFGWEYKGKHKDLAAAYDQLLQYREALENPPLLVVCDMDRIQVHTNFTNTPVRVYEIPLSELGAPRNLEIIRHVFNDPDKLKPGATSVAITAHAAERLGEIAQSMRARGLDPHQVARFLDRIVFCLFAEDVELLPKNLFSQLVRKTQGDPARFRKLVGQLFEAMTTGGDFGAETIKHFNGDLFTECPVPEVSEEEIEAILGVAGLDWAAIDPSIFGTLFERGMDPSKRAQIGAHYTSREDIEVLVEPVVMQPLRREWAATREVAQNLLATGIKIFIGGQAKTLSAAGQNKARREAEALIRRFLISLQNVKVLDPACGSGNFLYVTLQKLKDLEKEVSLFAGRNDLHGFLPAVGPWQLYGIEINPYAHELAQMTVWIGYLQWIRANGYGSPEEPILRKMNNFKCMDAILDLSDPANPKEPEWPKVDFIVGNPPFLGGNKIRAELGDSYVDSLFALYSGRIPPFSDLCCYWFERARQQNAEGKCKRTGLIATQSIRGGASREALQRIKSSGGIFFAESNRAWALDGANVHVSMVGFDDKSEKTKILDGRTVASINTNLTSIADITLAAQLKESAGICFVGASPKAPFEFEFVRAREMLLAPMNVNGRPNSDVVRPSIGAVDITKRDPDKWTVDFGLMEMDQAAPYELPFEYIRANILPIRQERRDDYRGKWWQYARPRVELREALAGCERQVVSPRHSKYRVFTRIASAYLADDSTIVFARSDDYFFGVLHSRLHEVWALKLGTRLETGRVPKVGGN